MVGFPAAKYRFVVDFEETKLVLSYETKEELAQVVDTFSVMRSRYLGDCESFTNDFVNSMIKSCPNVQVVVS